MNWMDEAACRAWPQEWWFPKKNEPAHQAITICNTCPVRAECLEHALANNETIGVWGGKSAETRRRITMTRRSADEARRLTQRQPIRHGTIGGYSTHRRRGEPPCHDCRLAHNRHHAAAKRHRRLTQEETA